jgi:CDP-paratose 2-epimerase
VYPYRRLNALPFVETATRFVLAENALYPGASRAGISEEFPLDGPRSLYGMTKLAAELMVVEYGAAYGLRFVINRCGLIAGPWQMGKTDQGVISLWMAAHYFGFPLRYIGFGGTGKQVRDVLHIDDLCDLIVEQAEHIDFYQGQVFNVGGGPENSVSLLELTDLCRQITGNAVPITAQPETRPADVRVYLTDFRRISGVRGWRPSRDVGTVLADVYRWLRANEIHVRPVLTRGMT